MKKTALMLSLPIMIALALTGCGDKVTENPAPATSPVITTPSPSVVAPAPVIPSPEKAVETSATGLENTDAAGLESAIKGYNAEVDASNDKAREIIDAYNERIQPSTGK